MIDGFIRVAAAAPLGAVASPTKNAQAHIRMAKDAVRNGAKVLVFPELSLSSYAIGDLVTQPSLLAACEEALVIYCAMTNDLDLISFVGIPVRVDGKVYSCAAAVFRGKVLGLVPKSHVKPGDVRGISAYHGENIPLLYCKDDVTFGTKQLFFCATQTALSIAVEFGDDFAAPCPPSVAHTAAGATVIACLAAEPEVIGAAARRRTLAEAHSARTLCGYLYAGAGESESTTDHVRGGHELITSLGRTYGERLPFAPFTEEFTVADLDVEHILFDRSRSTLFESAPDASYCKVPFVLSVGQNGMYDPIEQFPFVPAASEERTARCELILNIQARALAARLTRAHAQTLVLGVSGGLDSTLAVLVAVRALAHAGRPASDVVAVTMPCFGTTARTKSNAERLSVALGTTFLTVDIKQAVDVHFADIGHDKDNHNIVYENAQARERTQVLMDIANARGGLVVGTGDLSELALGWATYNGDHMSMYGVNAGIPKTMMRHIVAHEARCLREDENEEAAKVLEDILATPVSPELLPPKKNGEIAQCTEGIVGPYALHDFFLYHTVRWGSAPHKIYRMACHAFDGVFDTDTIKTWLTVFVKRFFAQQFKRSCLADGPAVGTVSLSPRGAWMMPSDALADTWLEELK